jgi:prepilin-type N-terminal cleavage/methylation domain-containing protein
MPERTRGFSLVEVIVTVFILGVALVVSHALYLGAPLAHSANNQDVALNIAQNELEGVRALGYASLPVSDAFADDLLASLPAGSGSVTVSAFNAGTKRVVVTVSWTERGKAQSLSLSTLITKAGGLP